MSSDRPRMTIPSRRTAGASPARHAAPDQAIWKPTPVLRSEEPGAVGSEDLQRGPVERHRPARCVGDVVVVRAEEHEVPERRRAALVPRLHVVGVAEAGGTVASRPAAPTITF